MDAKGSGSESYGWLSKDSSSGIGGSGREVRGGSDRAALRDDEAKLNGGTSGESGI